MVAGGLPTIQVLLDDGTGSFPYDITSYVRLVQGYSIQRGRQDELSAVTPGSLSLTLDNADGRFTIGSTLIASPSPIKVDAQIRVKETANGTAFTRYTGYVVAWPVAWPSGDDGFSTVTVSATDAQARAERRILRSFISEEIMSDSAKPFYLLDEAAGATAAADSSGGQLPSLLPMGDGSVVFGDAIGTLPAVRLAAPVVGTGVAFTAAQVAATTTAMTVAAVSFAFSVTGLAATTTNIAAAGTDFYGTGFGNFSVQYTGALYFQINGNGSTLGTTSVLVNDGALHVAEVQYSAGTWYLYLDGTQVDSVAAAAPSPVTQFTIKSDNTNSGAYVRAAAFAAYPTAPGATRAGAHAKAIRTGFAGESGTLRLQRLARYAGITAGTLDTSLTNIPTENLVDMTAGTVIHDVADAEKGLAFIDGTGSLAFHNRNRVPLKTSPDVSIDANYVDPGTAITTDMQGILNYFEATAAGSANGAQVARSTTSETSHGRYSGSATYLVQTDQEALDRAIWIVLTHKEPGPRAGTLVLDLLTMTAAQQAQMLAIEPDHWLQVTGLPSQAPGGTTANFIVQGFTENLSADAWTLSLNVADKATLYPAVFILDSSTLDSSALIYL